MGYLADAESTYRQEQGPNCIKVADAEGDSLFEVMLTARHLRSVRGSAVIGMGKSLKPRVIAEGVETAKQAAFLLALHCDEGQGYFFGRPVGAEALAILLQTGVSPALPH